ncbi:MAG: hypothetical protein Kow0088_05640 [Anaerolineales bacterium]
MNLNMGGYKDGNEQISAPPPCFTGPLGHEKSSKREAEDEGQAVGYVRIQWRFESLLLLYA